MAVGVPPANLHTGDSVIVTSDGVSTTGLQFSGAMRTSVGFIYANMCNNSSAAINEGSITIDFLVLR